MQSTLSELLSRKIKFLFLFLEVFLFEKFLLLILLFKIKLLLSKINSMNKSLFKSLID